MLNIIYHLDNYKLKQQWNITTLIEWQKPKMQTFTKCRQGCEAAGTFIHCWWECKRYSHFWRQPDSFKTQHTLLTQSSNLHLDICPNVENLHPYKNPYTDVHSSFRNCQKLGTIKTPFSRWKDKYPVVHLDNENSIQC